MKSNSRKNSRKLRSRNKKYLTKFSKHWLDAVDLKDMAVLADSTVGPGIPAPGIINGIYANISTNYGWVNDDIDGESVFNASAAWIMVAYPDAGGVLGADAYIQIGYCSAIGLDPISGDDFPDVTNCLLIEIADPLVGDWTGYYPEYAPSDGDDIDYAIVCDTSGASHPQGMLWDLYADTFDGEIIVSMPTFFTFPPFYCFLCGESKGSANLPGTSDDPVYISDCQWWVTGTDDMGNPYSYVEDIPLVADPSDANAYVDEWGNVVISN